MKVKLSKQILVAACSLCTAAAMAATTVMPVFADAGEKPPEVTEEERVFPDPDSFSYDDVEINFAKALQYSLYFYDANKCGPGITGGNLEWRGDCHVEDATIPSSPWERISRARTCPRNSSTSIRICWIRMGTDSSTAPAVCTMREIM